MTTSVRTVLLLFVFSFGVLFMGPSEASAQRWLQTSQLLTEIKTEQPTRALLDTLVQVVDRKDSIQVKRTPDATQSYSLSSLRDKLINEQGIGLTSANFVFIDYRFEIQNRGFEETIESFQFVYRPPGGAQEDIQMMYVDASEPWVQNILHNKGTTLVTNEAALRTFSDQLSFARTVQDGKIVEIAGKTVREGFERKKRELVQKIQRLTYESM